MKKFVVLSLISFLILAFGATVYGQEAPALVFKASGFMDVIGEYNRNVPQPGAATSATGGTSTNNVVFGPPPARHQPSTGDDQAFDKHQAYTEGRGRLRFDAILGKEMMGTFQFEFDSTRWGERVPAGSTAQRNYAGFWGVADRSALELKHMYFTFGMPWIPVQTTIQAGIQPIGIRPSIFMSTDGPAITAAFKFDPAYVKLFWAKPLEGKDWASDDDDVYGIEANVRISTFTIGGYFTWWDWNSYPAAFEGTAGFPLNRSEALWTGLYVDGKLGPVLLNFDFCLDDGKIEDRSQTSARGRDVDLSGWGAILNIGFPWEKFLFGTQLIYGTGADQKKTNPTGFPSTSTVQNATGTGGTPWGTTPSKVGAFLVPGGTEASNSHALVVDGAGINRGNTGFEPAADIHSRSGFGGLWIAKLYGAFQVSPIFNTRLEVMYIGDTTDNGNTIGNALKSDGRPRDDNSVGIEVDWLNTLNIYKNLTFQFGGGILWAGDAMDYAVRGGAPGNNQAPNAPYALVANLTYSF